MLTAPRHWRLRLVRIDPEANCRRHWSVSLEPTLYCPDGALVRRWGRIGAWTRTGAPQSLEPEPALALARTLAQAKLRRGYVVAACSWPGLVPAEDNAQPIAAPAAAETPEVDMKLQVFLKIGIAEVVCPRCEELVDPEATVPDGRPRGLVVDCPCGFKVFVAGSRLDAALPRHYADHSICIDVEPDPIPVPAVAGGVGQLPLPTSPEPFPSDG